MGVRMSAAEGTSSVALWEQPGQLCHSTQGQVEVAIPS
jgi:hypothetical protein